MTNLWTTGHSDPLAATVEEAADGAAAAQGVSDELQDQDLSGDVEILDAHNLYPDRFDQVGAALIRPFATGQGGMVYYGKYELRPGAVLPVAVKFALSVDNSEAVIEADMLSLLNHHVNVIGFYGICFWQDRLGVVMELAE